MRSKAYLLAATLAAILLSSAPALADKHEYTTMPPEQIEKIIRLERQAYASVMKKLRELENGPMDKASSEYKAKHEALLNEAVERKVELDSMREALAEQQRAYGSGN
ncbi:hypothetical protein NNJEOMEG_01359 [Fundidesulfovibrio magnetotacticus]|uniref:Uncharacterized protein n=1 Tax=Fundidesulfovibrio magnetotacticus TaxID=2730080 RepID=A0A6V8LZ69_9BACT|nr:hypothetical protein [Fundidesulfovibrio magnetotacticus]GFK93525.1 hypothetical protein NNJEOMEG_01359 [Fundidesulfovibrio magnetotacticus]